MTHAIEVQGGFLFEVAAAGIAQLREAGFIAPLAPDAVVRVGVRLAPVVHEVPLAALTRWANGPSVSPREEMVKRKVR